MDEIRIGFDINDISEKSTDEKLDILLKIAFLNHKTLNDHGEILFGNGKQGLCDIARFHNTCIKVLWGLFVMTVLGFGSVLFAHVSK